MKPRSDAAPRVLYIAMLLTSFVVIGAPGGGGRGGSPSAGSSASRGYSGSRSYTRTSRSGYSGGGYNTYTRGAVGTSRRTTFLSVGFLVLLGFLIWFTSRKKEEPLPASDTLPLATVRITIALLLLGDARAHTTFFDRTIKKNNFALPSARVSTLASVIAYLRSLEPSQSFVQKKRYNDARNASDGAEALYERQVTRVDRPRDSSLADSACCVAGFTLTTTADIARKIRANETAEGLRTALQSLAQASTQSLDAFYLFYAPAPGEALTLADGETMLRDLRTMGTPSLAEQEG